MKKVIRPGKLPDGDLFCKIEITDGKLSISGVIGPTHDGNAKGSCGQVNMGFAHRDPANDDKRYSQPTKPSEFVFAPGWTADLWLDFLDIWDRWHLNDMKANCVHQIGPAWKPKDVTLYHFRLTDKARQMQSNAKEAAQCALKTGAPFTPTPEQTFMANLEWSLTYWEPNPPAQLGLYYCPAKPLYNGDKGASETKSTGWLKESEHPEGYLSKPCPVCGYKYGNAWNREELPQEVIAFLEALPTTDKTPAWV